MNLRALAADIANRVDAMSQDCAINNEALILGLLEQELVPVKELKGSVPVVLYFNTQKDADEFIGLVKEAKPWMTEKKL